MPTDEKEKQVTSREDGTFFPLGTIVGVMDQILTGEEAVWVKLAEELKPEHVVGLEVFVRLPA